MVAFIRNWIALFKESHAYKLYVAFVLLALLKQAVSYTELVDTSEYICAAKSMFNSALPESCLNASQQHELALTRRTPGYLFLLYVTGFVPVILMGIQAVISLSIPLIAKQCLLFLTEEKVPQKWLQWLLLLEPLQFFYTGFLMPEIWTAFLLVLLLYMFLSKSSVGMLFCLWALVLLKPVFVLLLVISSIYAIVGFRKRWILLLSWIPVLALSYQHYHNHGFWHYSSISIENKWAYNQKAALQTAMNAEKLDSFYVVHHQELQTLGYKEKAQYMDSISNANIQKHLFGYLWLHTKGCVKMIFDPGRYDFVAFMGWPEGKGFMQTNESGILSVLKMQSPLVLIYLIIFVIIGLWKWVWFLMGIRKNKALGLTLMVVLILFIGVTGPVGSARYLFPFASWIAIVASLSRITHENTTA